MQVKVSLERLKRKLAERQRGIREADAYYYDSYSSTRSKAYKSRHVNQNPN